MTATQKGMLLDARSRIEGLRNLLDEMMYGQEQVDDNEYLRIREAYDLICQANDKL